MPVVRYRTGLGRRQEPGGGSGAPSEADDLLGQIAAEGDIDPALLEQLMGSGGNQNDLSIFTEGPGLDTRVGTTYRAGYGRPGPPIGNDNRSRRAQNYTGQRLVSSTVGELLQKFYQLDTSTLQHFQALLFAGGFYGQGVESTDIEWGQYDDNSFSAYANLIGRTARLNAAGEEITYNDVLREAATASGVDMRQVMDALRAGDEEVAEGLLTEQEDLASEVVTKQGDVIQIMLEDPNRLRATIDQSASAVLGRRATADEQRMFISMIYNLQRQGQTALQTAEPGTTYASVPGEIAAAAQEDAAAAAGLDESIPEPEDVVVEYAAPDPEAQAEALLRQQNPAEAGAHDIALQFANFLEFLGGVPGIDVPRLTVQ